MSFDSLEYFGFIAILIIAYFSVRSLLLKQIVLVLGSYIFYSSFTPAYTILLVAITVAAFLFASVIQDADHPRRKKIYLTLALVLTLLPLLYFKYRNFISENVNMFLPQNFKLSYQNIIFPIGISFFTFNILSYLIESVRSRRNEKSSFLEFAAYVSFFPSILSGPLMRPSEFIPQLRLKIKMQSGMIWEGLVLITLGLFKKLVFSDNLGIVVDKIFASPAKFSGPELVLGAYAFTIQIYCDFSGYTDIARGVARLFGFHLPINFNFPYLARNPGEFWERWHISLSTWFKDYVYVPLGGNRKGIIRTALNLFIVMFLCGLWHGASWHFVFWGIYHGVLLILYRYFGIVSAKVKSFTRNLIPVRLSQILAPLQHALAVLLMFHLVVVGWIIFKTENIKIMLGYLGGMLSMTAYNNVSQVLQPDYRFVLVGAILFVIYNLFSLTLNIKDIMLRQRFNPYVLSALVLMAIVTMVFRVDQSVQFIYFRF